MEKNWREYLLYSDFMNWLIVVDVNEVFSYK